MTKASPLHQGKLSRNYPAYCSRWLFDPRLFCSGNGCSSTCVISDYCCSMYTVCRARYIGVNCDKIFDVLRTVFGQSYFHRPHTDRKTRQIKGHGSYELHSRTFLWKLIPINATQNRIQRFASFRINKITTFGFRRPRSFVNELYNRNPLQKRTS
jgi:hypothetical protein